VTVNLIAEDCVRPVVASKKKGRIHVYTGDGKGKTTAAFGLAMRAAGRGLSVLIIQFMKGCSECGEIISAKRLPGILVEQFGTEDFIDAERISEKDCRLALKGMERAKKAMLKKEADLLILDEINVAVHFGLLSAEQVLELIDAKPAGMELVLTGRYAKPAIIRRADYVTEMKSKKHPFKSGQEARDGIEC
jgi:cob(I)alamin adenosyltransferase